VSLIAAYLDHLRVERRLSAHTLESYGRDLAALAAFADASRRNLEDLDRGALDAFVQRQRGRGQSPRSVARAVAAVRGFSSSSSSIGARPESGRGSAAATGPAALPKFPSVEDVDALLASRTPRRRSACAIARSSSCCTPRACACPSSWACATPTCTSTSTT
jgi:integrase/recombinase XerC